MCDTLCLVRPDGTLFAKASDRPPAEAQVVESHRRRSARGRSALATQYLRLDDTGAAALVGSRPAWLWGFEHGVNEHRVAVSNEKIRTARDVAADPAALIGMDLVRLVCERARTAGEGVEVLTSLLEQHGQGGAAQAPGGEPYDSSFLIADPTEAHVVETFGREWVSAPAGSGCAISNRLSLAPEWADPTAAVDHADRRLAATRAAVAGAAPADRPSDLVAVLRHHGHHAWGAPGAVRTGPVDPVPRPGDAALGGDDRSTVCMHARDRVATTAAMVCWLPRDPDRRARTWVALGSPCASVFVPVAVDDVPTALGDVATWERFAALARRVEDDPDELPLVREVLDPLEDALWGADDEVDVAGADPLRQHAVHRRSWEAVDAALGQLGV